MATQNAVDNTITGQAGTVATITGLAPDTATTQATQGNITSLGTLTGLTSGGAVDFSTATDVRITSADPTADSEIAIDLTPPTEFADDIFTFWGGASIMTSVALEAGQLPSGAAEDGFSVTYNATNNEFELTDVSSSGANTALSNLSSVAINTALVSDTYNTDALGTSAIAWSDLFLGTGSVIDWSSAASTSDMTLTHSSNTLTFAGGTVALGTATATGGLTADVIGDLTGNADTVTVADAGGDTTTFPLLGTAATGSLAPATDAGLTYNATTNALTAASFIGALTGNADTVTTNANLTGDVTSSGNATTIEAAVVDVAMLSNGTDGELITWDASGVAATVAVGTATHVLTSNGVGVAPTFQAAAGSYYTWSEETGTSFSAAVNNAYIINNASLNTVTIPTTAALGERVILTGKGAGGWLLAQNASEIVHFGNQSTTTGAGGSLASTNSKDTIEIVCVVANTEWNVISSVGNITVV